MAGSGRTDTGVHALAQIAAFSLENPIPPGNLQRAINRLLPPAIRVLEVREMQPEFHPRFDAVAKTYRYTLHRAPICSPFEWRYVHHYPYPLNEKAMIAAASIFEGTHDFTALAASDPRNSAIKSKVRTIFSSVMIRAEDKLIYTVRGSGFLRHMVRNIVGSLVLVGNGKWLPQDIKRTLDARDRAAAGTTAPACGLYFLKVDY